MTFEEIEEVLYSAEKTTARSVRGLASYILTYTNWAIENGYRNSNLPLFTSDSIASQAEKYVSKKSIYFTQDDLFKDYSKLNNYNDILILQCIFEGIRGQGSSEMFSLRIENLFKKEGKYYVNLYDTEKGTERFSHEISEYLFNLMYKVNDLEFIYDVKGRQLKLIPSPYIFKKTPKGNKNQLNGEKLTETYLTNKSTYFKEVFGTKLFRIMDIEKSGVMHYLYEIMQNKDTEVVTNNEYKMISEKFNIGKYIHPHYREEQVNYTAIKDMIDLDFYIENYGDIVLT